MDTDGSASYSNEIAVARDVGGVQLHAPYPNPARQQVTVRYAVPERRDVTARLYDALGRVVRTVADEKVKGRSEQTIDVSQLPSGVYFLRLSAGEATRVQKLTVVR